MTAESLRRVERLIDGGDIAAALQAARELARREPALAQAQVLAGKALALSGDIEGAANAFDTAVQADPQHADAHLELARLHATQRQYEEALDEFSLALLYRPQNASAHFELGKLHAMMGKPEAAITSLKHAVDLDGTLAAAHAELGHVYLRLQKLVAAVEVLERAAELDAGDVDVLNRLGYALVRTEQYDRARNFFARVCARTPPYYIGARLNLANALSHLGDHAAARAIYDEVLRFAPNDFQARWNRAHLLLAARDFERGWEEYENRWMIASVWKPRRIPFVPWTGQPLEGRTLLVSAEQGLGDEIMFASCIPELAVRAGRVVLECEKRLEGIFRRSFPGVMVVGSERDAGLPDIAAAGAIDYHAPLGSLPLQLRRREAQFPRHRGYLRADPVRIARWRTRLEEALGPGRKIGLSWRGGTADTRRSMRSVTLEQLLPLLKKPGAQFVSLQYGGCEAEVQALRDGHGIRIAHWQEAIDDYEETAALSCAVDLTVSVCTALIHLNGALGRPVWVLVPAVPEWRYGFRGTDMPWYPSARLFRQREAGVWQPVIEQVSAELDAFCRE